MSHVLYGVSVGPGDPELMTLKACRIIRECGTVAFPGKAAETEKAGGSLTRPGEPSESADPIFSDTMSAGTKHDTESGRENRPLPYTNPHAADQLVCMKKGDFGTALAIAASAVPEIREKKLLALDFPMTKDPDRLRQAHIKAARRLEEVLDHGEDVVFLTLGDVTIYSTFSYVQRIVESDGYQVRLISGVTSFCAAAARLGRPLVLGNEALHICPADKVLQPEEQVRQKCDVYVLMKAGRNLKALKEALERNGMDGQMIENCGMPDEKVSDDLSQIPDKAGYFSIVIAGGGEKNDAPV